MSTVIPLCMEDTWPHTCNVYCAEKANQKSFCFWVAIRSTTTVLTIGYEMKAMNAYQTTILANRPSIEREEDSARMLNKFDVKRACTEVNITVRKNLLGHTGTETDRGVKRA